LTRFLACWLSVFLPLFADLLQGSGMLASSFCFSAAPLSYSRQIIRLLCYSNLLAVFGLKYSKNWRWSAISAAGMNLSLLYAEMKEQHEFNSLRGGTFCCTPSRSMYSTAPYVVAKEVTPTKRTQGETPTLIRYRTRSRERCDRNKDPEVQGNREKGKGETRMNLF
ncbi:hypothetical protein KCU77_g99, partial [Aureobasidium melanogenum]